MKKKATIVSVIIGILAVAAIIVFSAQPVSGESYEEELKWYTWFKERKIPVLLIINKADVADAAPLKNYLKEIKKLSNLNG